MWTFKRSGNRISVFQPVAYYWTSGHRARLLPRTQTVRKVGFLLTGKGLNT